MALTIGANLGLLSGGASGDSHFNEIIKFFRGVDLLVMPRVKSVSTTTPPASPADGDSYVIPAGATGVWSGKTGQIARWSAQQTTPAYDYAVPKKGWQVWVDDKGKAGQMWTYSGTAWAGNFAVPTYADQTAAGAAGLLAGDLFMQADGSLMVKT